jgi:signal peptidase I
MPAKWHKYSYTAQRAERRTIVAVLFTVVFLSVAFVLINRYLVGMYVVRTDAMEPTLSSGDCVATTSLYRQRPAPDRSLSPLIAPARGDLVVLAPHYTSATGFPIGRGHPRLVPHLPKNRPVRARPQLWREAGD